MDFFKSVFSADPDPSDVPHRNGAESDGEDERHPQARADDLDPEDNSSPLSAGGRTGGTDVWGFGGLIKTLSSKSEAVIQTYRRDLEEFGSGLKKETAAIREAAARAVRDLPGSLDAGASVAQESLESVGQAIDDLGGSVVGIISQGKDALLSMDSEAAAASDYSDVAGQQISGSSKRYSRFEVQVLGIQSDQNTFLEDPEDSADFEAWISGFNLGEEDDEVDQLCAENPALEGIFTKLVPRSVDYETFWNRYFYKVHKLRQAEDARAELVKRVISREEKEEDLSWEIDDDDEGEESVGDAKKVVATQVGKPDLKEEEEEINASQSEKGVADSTKTMELDEKPDENSQVKSMAEVASNVPPESEGNVQSSEPTSEVPMVAMPDDKMILEEKAEPVDSCKDSDFSVVSSQPSMPEEDDLGWDEIEDLGESDEKKACASTGVPNKIDLRKRLSAAEDDEDLSWDIEDD